MHIWMSSDFQFHDFFFPWITFNQVFSFFLVCDMARWHYFTYVAEGCCKVVWMRVPDVEFLLLQFHKHRVFCGKDHPRNTSLETQFSTTKWAPIMNPDTLKCIRRLSIILHEAKELTSGKQIFPSVNVQLSSSACQSPKKRQVICELSITLQKPKCVCCDLLQKSMVSSKSSSNSDVVFFGKFQQLIFPSKPRWFLCSALSRSRTAILAEIPPIFHFCCKQVISCAESKFTFQWSSWLLTGVLGGAHAIGAHLGKMVLYRFGTSTWCNYLPPSTKKLKKIHWHFVVYHRDHLVWLLVSVPRWANYKFF